MFSASPIMTINCRRSTAIEAFHSFRHRGRFASLWARLQAKNAHLKDFNPYAPLLQAGRRYLGVQEIPVQQITGSLSRTADFDHSFHPLKKHLRDRWANIYLLRTGTDNWPAIQVHKMGEDYFVEDGHHRVSVARYLGLAFIQAEVWEHPVQTVNHETSLTHGLPAKTRQVKTSPAHP